MKGNWNWGPPHYPQVLDDAFSIFQIAGLPYGGRQLQAVMVQGSLFYGTHLEGSLPGMCIATRHPSMFANRPGLYKDRLHHFVMYNSDCPADTTRRAAFHQVFKLKVTVTVTVIVVVGQTSFLLYWYSIRTALLLLTVCCQFKIFKRELGIY